jgi:hypothetical protein
MNIIAYIPKMTSHVSVRDCPPLSPMQEKLLTVMVVAFIIYLLWNIIN